MAYLVRRRSPAAGALLWKQASPLIEAAIAEAPTLMSLHDIEKAVCAGTMSLWEVRDAKEVLRAAFVTEIARGSLGAAVNVVALGGDGVEDWIEQVTYALQRYASVERCLFVAEQGRCGWTKILERLGWSRGPTTMILKVE